MSLTKFCGVLGCALGLLLSGALPAWGIILYSDGTAAGLPDTANTVAPTGQYLGSGWQWEGSFNYYLATPVAPNWILTAKHLNQPVGQNFTLGANTYTTTARTDIAGTDFSLYKVNGTFASYAALYDRFDEQDQTAVVFGRGKPRGPAVTVSSVLKGWQAGNTDHTERWGTILISGSVPTGGGPLLMSVFSNDQGANESQLATGDSGGGAFLNDNGIWKLAGVNYSVSGPYNTSASSTGSFFGGIFDFNGIYENWGNNQYFPAYNNSQSYLSQVSSGADDLRTAINLGSWRTDGPGNWSDMSNWNVWGSFVPNSIDAAAEFYNGVTAATTVTVDAPVTVGTIEFNSPAAGYTINASGAGQITLSTSAINPNTTIRALQGSHTLSAPIVLTKSLNIDVQQSQLTLAGAINNSAGVAITKTGAGDLTLSGPQTHAAATQFYASAGKTTFASDGGSQLSVTVSPGAEVDLGNGANHHLASLTLQANSLVNAPQGGNRLVELSALSIGAAAKLDLKDSSLLLHATAGTKASVLGTLTSQIVSGRAGGLWNGNGLTTSLAAADPNHLTALALVLNDNGSGSPLLTTFRGSSVGVNDLLLKYTYYGDANLDGVVNGADYVLVANGLQNHLTGWYNGDFNYDGVVSAVDLALLDNTYNFFPNVPLAAWQGTLVAVPEPGSWAIATGGLLGLLVIRRRLGPLFG